jgi:carbonic anhydrase
MCGGCHAALHRSMAGAEPGRGGFIADWIAMLDDASEQVRSAHQNIDNREAGRAMELAAVRVSLDNLMTFPCIQEKVRRGTLTLRGAFFAISDGVLHVMDEATGEFAPA